MELDLCLHVHEYAGLPFVSGYSSSQFGRRDQGFSSPSAGRGEGAHIHSKTATYTGLQGEIPELRPSGAALDGWRGGRQGPPQATSG
jgi:hypothetical protein